MHTDFERGFIRAEVVGYDDFIEYNGENGGPAPEKVTNLVFDKTTSISSYKICDAIPDVDLTKPGTHNFGSFGVASGMFSYD